MPTPERSRAAPEENGDSLKSRLACHLSCLAEDATNQTLSRVEHLAFVQERSRKIRELRQELAGIAETQREPIRRQA